MDGNATESSFSSRGVKPNVNCLHGKRCPKCGSYEPFEVVVSVRVLLYDNGSDDAKDGSIECDDDALAMCYACRYQGKFGEFNVR